MHVNDEQRSCRALEAAGLQIWDATTLDGAVRSGDVAWGAGGAALLGLPRAALHHRFSDFLQMVFPADRELVHDRLQHALDGSTPFQIEFRVQWPDTSLHWLCANGNLEDATAVCGNRLLGVVGDVTARKKAELDITEQRELGLITLRSIGDGVITTDSQGLVRSINRAAEQLSGWPSEDAVGHSIEAVFVLEDEATGELFENVALKSLRLGTALGVSARSMLVSRGGRRIPIEDSAAPIRAPDGRILGAVLVFRDVSHARKLGNELSWQATHDMLTGLINRREFESLVASALASAKHESDRHALLYLDLDQFKIVNDTCGHAAGDALLRQLAQLLQTQMRDSDILARLGGDELGVLLRNCPIDTALRTAEKLRVSVNEFRFLWDRIPFEVGVSIGVVAISEESKSLSDVLSSADQACYSAKEQGRNRVNLYRESDVLVARRHGDELWVARLKDAFRHNTFELHLQPIMHLDYPRQHHAEVLVRMRSENGTQILPGAFIPAAERYNLMPQLDRWVIRQVCEQLARREASQALSCLWYSINLSAMSLSDDHLFAYIEQQFRVNQIQPQQICFEISESAAIGNLNNAQQFVARIKALGCQVALDDFGSGLSSFAYLKSLPVDFLKIDGVFVRDVDTNLVNHAMVNAINDVGHVMGIKTVAEFVATASTLQAVREMGIDFAQGDAVGPLIPFLQPS